MSAARRGLGSKQRAGPSVLLTGQREPLLPGDLVWGISAVSAGTYTSVWLLPPRLWPKDSQALQHEEENGVYQVGAELDGSVDGHPSDAPGTVSFKAAEAEPCSVMNTIICKLEVSGTETFIHWRRLSLPNAFSQEGSKREFSEHVKTPHFHIFWKEMFWFGNEKMLHFDIPLVTVLRLLSL